MHLSSAPLGSFDVAQYLGRSGDSRALPVLLTTLRSGGTYIRSTSALGLGYLGNRAAIPQLLNTFLTDIEIYVRGDAALALGMLHAEEALSKFKQRFLLEDFEVQKRMLMAIPQIGTPHARVTVDILRIQLQEMKSQKRRNFLRTLLDQAENRLQ